MKTLTVFTPTYNRAHLLPRLYESLCAQTSMDFLWLVIDDGSTDATKELIAKWKSENKIEIQYHYKENGGMHTGHNAAYRMIETELNVCIDSDDAMPNDAVEKIISLWNSMADKSKIAGIIGLDADQDGKIIGTNIPENLIKGSLQNLHLKHRVSGDKKLILRTDLVKKYPAYPEFKGEKLVPLGVLYTMMGADYDFVYSNEVYCIVEYQPEGSSGTIFKQYFQSPRGFAYSRTIEKTYSNSLIYDLKKSMLLGVSAIVTKDYSLLNEKPKIWQNYLMFPFAFILFSYLKLRIR